MPASTCTSPRPPPRPCSGGWGSRAARRRSRTRSHRQPGTASPRRGSPARPTRRRTSSRDPSGKNRRGLAQDQVLLLQPFHLPPQPLHLRLLGLALGQCLGRPGRQVLSWPVLKPSSVATSDNPLPPSSSRLTACALNSAVNRRRLRLSAISSSWGVRVR